MFPICHNKIDIDNISICLSTKYGYIYILYIFNVKSPWFLYILADNQIIRNEFIIHGLGQFTLFYKSPQPILYSYNLGSLNNITQYIWFLHFLPKCYGEWSVGVIFFKLFVHFPIHATNRRLCLKYLRR